MNNLEAAKAMRNIPEDEREELIAKADNVFGYERFMDKRNQVALKDAYRKPPVNRGTGNGPKSA
jgi:hypothetical protein